MSGMVAVAQAEVKISEQRTLRSGEGLRSRTITDWGESRGRGAEASPLDL